mmetsp:Transcript_71/g.242  ORF Transcript_71/g.242 Transcript_71/m.242 type:complete len:880 (+) Transcript_71:94-2733(+)
MQLLFCCALAWTLRLNEGYVIAGRLSKARSHASSLEERVANMTLDEATRIFAEKVSAPAEVKESVQQQLSLIKETQQRGQSGFLRKEGSSEGQPSEGRDTDKAVAQLNRLLEGTWSKMDLSDVQCFEVQKRLRDAMESISNAAAETKSQSAESVGKISAAEAQRDAAHKQVERLGKSLRETEESCNMDKQVLEKQRNLAQNDVLRMRKAVEIAECKNETNPASVLIQCPHASRQQSLMAVGRFTFGNEALGAALAEIRSLEVRAAIQESLSEVFAESSPAGSTMLIDAGRRLQAVRRSRRLEPDAICEATCASNITDWREKCSRESGMCSGCDECEPFLTQGANPEGEVETSGTPDNSKCAMRSNPNCGQVEDRFLQILSGVEDTVNMLSMKLTENVQKCKDRRANLQQQHETQTKQMQESISMLASASERWQEACQQMAQQEQQLAGQQKALLDSRQECAATRGDFLNEICGLSKIRNELVAMNNDSSVTQDCGVSEWTELECSVSCGGGTARRTREVTMMPSIKPKGAGCPPLEMETRCNTQECPIDCEVEEWQGWSDCTADCGGGVMFRDRTIKQEPLHGGEQCGESREVKSCNTAACDAPCELSDWGPWSQCSKMCGGGSERRLRTVKEPARGAGTCAEPYSPERQGYRPCNLDPCVTQANQTLECRSKLDLILLLDGSGSVGMEGWEAMKSAAKMMLGAFPGGHNATKVGVLLYSGPRTEKAYMKCAHSDGSENVDMEQDCNMRWLSHLTEDVQSVQSTISSAEWPKGGTMTSAALMTAEAELIHGREDAPTTVVVVTDNRPLSPLRTSAAAKKLKEKARLMWVLVTRSAPTDKVNQWASRPVRENIIKVDDFESLAKPRTINTLVADLCPKVA